MSYLEFINAFPDFTFLKPIFESGIIHPREWKNGDIVLHCSTKLNSLYFITSGRARAYKPLSNGKEVIYAPYGPGDIAGDVEYIVDMEATGSLIAVKNLKGYIINKDIITSVYSDRFYKLIAEGVTRKLINASRNNAIRAGYTLEERVAHYCLREYEAKIYSMEELAGILGATYRHLSRVFKKFTDLGYIEIHKNELKILNHTALDNLSSEISEDMKFHSDN